MLENVKSHKLNNREITEMFKRTLEEKLHKITKGRI